MNPFIHPYANEDELVRAAQSGSREALEKLVKLHQRFIYNLALKYVRDGDEAADLAQEALIKMITKLDQFKGRVSFERGCIKSW